jgi:NitT/TauT family transport system ATP-binding protein
MADRTVRPASQLRLTGLGLAGLLPVVVFLVVLVHALGWFAAVGLAIAVVAALVVVWLGVRRYTTQVRLELVSTTSTSSVPLQEDRGPQGIQFEGVSKRFADGTVALAGLDLNVASGEFVGVVGPLGCGKSTLLRIASGRTLPTEGTVVVQTDKIGYVSKETTLLPWRTVQANVEMFAKLSGLPKHERRRRADAAIKLVGLSDFAGHHPRSLSGGMRMRVSLARSLTLQPELFLFDEPFGALDEITRERLNDELQQLFLTLRFTALYVTHSVTEAVFMSTRVVVMSGRPGRVVGDFAVPFEYPRPPRLRFDEEFARLAGEVSASLRGAGWPGRPSPPSPQPTEGAEETGQRARGRPQP